MHHWQVLFRLNRIRKTHISMKKELRLIDLKTLKGELGFHPHAGVARFSFDWSFEYQFHSSSRRLSETMIGKWVLLMLAVRTL